MTFSTHNRSQTVNSEGKAKYIHSKYVYYLPVFDFRYVDIDIYVPHVSVALDYLHLELLRLHGNEAELGHEGGRVQHGVVVTQLRCK